MRVPGCNGIVAIIPSQGKYLPILATVRRGPKPLVCTAFESKRTREPGLWPDAQKIFFERGTFVAFFFRVYRFEKSP